MTDIWIVTTYYCGSIYSLRYPGSNSPTILYVALFEVSCYVCSDGLKMSKRLKNYPDPMNVVKKFGADALRLYLVISPVVRAETLKFNEDGVKNVVKDVFLPHTEIEQTESEFQYFSVWRIHTSRNKFCAINNLLKNI